MKSRPGSRLGIMSEIEIISERETKKKKYDRKRQNRLIVVYSNMFYTMIYK